MQSVSQSRARLLSQASWLAAFWAFCYGLYRSYYAAGGTFGMLGTPVSIEQFRRINAIAGVLLFVAAALPLVLRNAWRRSSAHAVLLALCWFIAVACVSHALIGIIQRIASLTGQLTIPYPFWKTIDRRQADLQALFFNEPWFLIEGLLWAAIGWAGALSNSPRRGWWVASALAAIAGLTILGLLSAFGVIGKWIAG